MSQKQTFDRLVLFPTPLTPTNVILYGIRCWFDASGADSLLRMDNSRSVEVLGVSIRVKEVDSASRTVLLVANNKRSQYTEAGKDRSRFTLKRSNLLPYQIFSNSLTNFIGDLHCDILLHEMLLHRFKNGIQICFI